MSEHKLALTLAEPLAAGLSPGRAEVRMTATSCGKLLADGKLITDIWQTPVLLITDTTSSILLLVGVFRRAVVIFPHHEDRFSKQTFLLPGVTRLTSSNLSATPAESCITLRTGSLEFVVSLSDGRLTVTPDPQPGAQPALFKRLLHSIDTLADLQARHDRRSDLLETTIASFNAFLTSPPQIGAPSVTKSPTSPSPPPPQPPPIVGCTAFVNVPVVPVLDHWFIRCEVTPITPKRVSTLHPRLKPSLRSVTTLPLADIVSFPFSLSSHGPLKLAFSLIFQNSEIHSSDATLDILDFSHATKQFLSDSSHLLLAPLPTLLSSKDRATTITTLRLQLPLPQSELEHLPSGNFATVLGGSFTITHAPGSKSSTTVITIRGAYHIAPFVRAALLRRVLKKDAFKPVTIDGAASITRWKRRLADGLDDWLPSFRRAETALIHAKALFERLERGDIEECYDKGEKVACDDALANARATYGMLRRNVEGLWSVGDGVL